MIMVKHEHSMFHLMVPGSRSFEGEDKVISSHQNLRCLVNARKIHQQVFGPLRALADGR